MVVEALELDPRVVPEAKVIAPVELNVTVPVLADEPSTLPDKPPLPIVKVEEVPRATLPVKEPEVSVNVELVPRVIFVESILLALAVIATEDPRTIAESELLEVPTLPAKV